MRRLVLVASFYISALLIASPSPGQKPTPVFYLTTTLSPDHRLDWGFDNIIFGTNNDEVNPDLCMTPDGQYLYATCSSLNDEGEFDYLRLRWSTGGGSSWAPTLDLHADNPLGNGRLAADNDYVYLVYEYFYAPDDVDIYLARLPTGSTNSEDLFILPIAASSHMEKAPAVHSDSRDNEEDPYLYITHAKLGEPDSLHYIFHLSIDQGASVHRSETITSFQGQSLEARSSLATGKLSDCTLMYFACEAERSGGRGSMIYVTTSSDLGDTWILPRALSTDYRAFSLPQICAHGGFAALAYQMSPVSGDLDILCSFSQDSGRSWSDGIRVSPGESYDTEPRIVIEPDGDCFHIGFAHFLSANSDSGTVWVRSGTSTRPDSFGLSVAVPNENLVAAGFKLGMCPGPDIQNLCGAAVAWTSYFVLGDLDVRFDAAWRGSASEHAVKLLPSEVALEQNWPNPFNQSTIIRFRLRAADRAQLTLTNILGREIECVSLGLLSPGAHAVTFDARGLSSGTYFYTLQTSSVKLTRKMIVVK
jgi:hypothetical protein